MWPKIEFMTGKLRSIITAYGLWCGTVFQYFEEENAKTSNGHMDWMIYQAWQVVENTFANLKNQRAISSRYDKLLNSYIGIVALACGFFG